MREIFLKFFGNHTIDFASCSREDLTRSITWEMRNLVIPGFDDIFLFGYDQTMAEVAPELRTKIFEVTEWTPLAFPGFTLEKQNIVLVGPMGLFLWFTPHHIELTSTLHERADWYSPQNKEKVMKWRTYFYTIITHFGGNTAIYISEKQANHLYNTLNKKPNEAFNKLANTLITKYGPVKETLFNFPNGKYPKYYIDTFDDIKTK